MSEGASSNLARSVINRWNGGIMKESWFYLLCYAIMLALIYFFSNNNVEVDQPYFAGAEIPAIDYKIPAPLQGAEFP